MVTARAPATAGYAPGQLAALDRRRSRVTMMAPRMSRTRRWLRLTGMTKVPAQMSISLGVGRRRALDQLRHHRRGDLHVLPCRLGDGTRLYEVADGSVRKLQNLGGDPNAATNLRFRAS